MNRLLKVVILGIVIWGLTLPWLEFNRFLMSPVVFGLLVGTGPAYFLGRQFGQRRSRGKIRPVRFSSAPTRPAMIFQTQAQSPAPTRPTPGISIRERASRSTHPMPALAR